MALITTLLEAAAQSKLFAKATYPPARSACQAAGIVTSVPRLRLFAFVYDKKNKLANPPKSLKELVERGPQKWRVIYEDPRTSTPGLGLLLDAEGLWRLGRPRPEKLAARNRYRSRLERSLWPDLRKGKATWC